MSDTDTSPTQEEDYRGSKYWRRRNKEHGVTGGIILLLLGVVFLLNNFNILPWEIWNIIWRFWPLLLVLWGFQVIFGHSWLGRFVTGVIGLAIAAFVFAYSASLVNPAFVFWMQSLIPGWNSVISVGPRLSF